LDGYDGHSLRAFSYFPERLPGIIDTVESINSIETLFPQVRQDSKGPTFLKTYGGTAYGLVKTLGFTPSKAAEIDENYHELYKESDAWVQARLDEASKQGYVELAFGLRLRTPLIAKSIRSSASMVAEAKQEERTAGNALGQSYGLLNNRAMTGFLRKVWASPYRYDILPICMIHDAIYVIWRDDIKIAKFVNDTLIEEMSWQELEPIKHDEVKLSAELIVYHPTWADEVRVSKHATEEELYSLFNPSTDSNSISSAA